MSIDLAAADRQSRLTITTVIVGAGFSGLCAAIKLKKSGQNNFVVLERADELGGTWRDNTYPGVACDIPAIVYSFSFAQKPDWSHTYAPGAEILAYLKSVARDYGIDDFIRFRQNVLSLTFDEVTRTWAVKTQETVLTARTVILSTGPLSEAAFPSIPGQQEFKGEVIHTAKWNHDCKFANKKVAVIGTGSTAIQLVPELVRKVGSSGQVKVFQRTAGWVLPRPLEFNASINRIFRRFPRVQHIIRRAFLQGGEVMAFGMVWKTPLTYAMEAYANHHRRSKIADPRLRRQVAPQTTLGCKRTLLSNTYYTTLQAENCELISSPISHISADGIVEVGGLQHRVDTIVYATGYEVSTKGLAYDVFGRHGRSLNEEWARGGVAYKSVAVTGFPNLFFIFGPNSGPGHNSAIPFLEAAVGYVVKAVKLIDMGKVRSLEVRRDAQDLYNRSMRARLAKTVWNSGCQSWYLTEDGLNPTMYPGLISQFEKQLRKFDTSAFVATV